MSCCSTREKARVEECGNFRRLSAMETAPHTSYTSTASTFPHLLPHASHLPHQHWLDLPTPAPTRLTPPTPHLDSKASDTGSVTSCHGPSSIVLAPACSATTVCCHGCVALSRTTLQTAVGRCCKGGPLGRGGERAGAGGGGGRGSRLMF
eukprot:363999-Chlamydomonas_euryale.AAC.15